MSSFAFCVLVPVYLLLVGLGLVDAAVPSPLRFQPYLLYNRWESGLPLSYYVPPNFFQGIPVNERPQFFTEGRYDPQCNGAWSTADQLNAYQFQTEELLTVGGLNLYDGAMWQIAVSLLGYLSVAEDYQVKNLVAHRTLQFENIKANKVCLGVVDYGQCIDESDNGGCGFCYGDTSDKTLDIDNAYFFRMVSDVWSYEGTQDARCPVINGYQNTWKWNDYRPVTGENSWASLIGPLQVAYLKAGSYISNIPDDSSAFTLAFNFIPAVEKMLVAGYGSVYYAPRNTWDALDPAIGDTISTENNVSLLAGLKMLLYILQTRTSRKYDSWIPRVDQLIKSVTYYMRSSYNAQYGYFSQGARYTGDTHVWTWVKEPFFAVDCQTWAISVLGKEQIDSWFGEGTTLRIWNNTKLIGGYQFNPETTWVNGVGFTQNIVDQIFSGEWSLGAINMLYVLAESYPGLIGQRLLDEAAYMRAALEKELITTGTLKGGQTTAGVVYANKRYFIPFGWYANPLWSTASTSWTVTTDLRFNPFYLGGAFETVY